MRCPVVDGLCPGWLYVAVARTTLQILGPPPQRNNVARTAQSLSVVTAAPEYVCTATACGPFVKLKIDKPESVHQPDKQLYRYTTVQPPIVAFMANTWMLRRTQQIQIACFPLSVIIQMLLPHDSSRKGDADSGFLSDDDRVYIIPRCRTDQLRKSFFIKTATDWNHLENSYRPRRLRPAFQGPSSGHTTAAGRQRAVPTPLH